MKDLKPKAKPKTQKNWLRENWLRVIVHIGSFGPLVWLIWRYFKHDLGVDPITTLNNVTGRTAMLLLLLCLSATPLYIVFNFRPGLKVRRALGLYAFMYASFHFINFIALDYAFDIPFIFQDGIPKKPYILVGFTALTILLLLAITSTKGWMRRLKINWTRLHWLIYPAGILVIIHFLWRTKPAEVFEPYVYGFILALLLIIRLPPVRMRIVDWRMRMTGTRMPTKRPLHPGERGTVPIPTTQKEIV